VDDEEQARRGRRKVSRAIIIPSAACGDERHTVILCSQRYRRDLRLVAHFDEEKGDERGLDGAENRFESSIVDFTASWRLGDQH